MTTNTAVQGTLTQILNGEVFSLLVLASMEHADLLDAAVSLGRPLVVYPTAVVSALQGLDQGIFPTKLVQSWASFVRRGYIGNPKGGPIQPLDIDYDDIWEDAIVEVVSRLEGLGDIIDGEITSDEVRSLLQ